MLVTTKAIVLHRIKYGESSVIVRMFTQDHGKRSYMIKGVLKAKKGRFGPALFQPMTQLEIVARHQNQGGLESIRDAKLFKAYSSLHTNVQKGGMALFLGEILNFAIQEEEANKPLYEYLESNLNYLDKADAIANFHLLFLIRLTHYLGFYPDVQDDLLPYFDLQEGCFVRKPSLNLVMEGEELIAFKKILGIKFDGVEGIKLNRTIRQGLLLKLLLYFELHLQGFRNPKSLAVLNAVFE